MHDLRTIQIPKIVESVQFELLCRDIWKNDKRNENVNINGRPGQSQNGVDVIGRDISSQNWFGIQCKVRKTGKLLTKKEIYSELTEAKNFNPSISSYIFCTTLDRDATLQELEREIVDELDAQNAFKFQLLFWDDIEEMLKEESNINIYMKYYQQFFIDNTTLGHSIAKLINLELGINNSHDTHYEIMIGKIPNYKDQKHTNANYYRGTYFIVNWHERRMETFPVPCHPSDLEQAFPNEYDRARICEWINSIKDIDMFIYDDENTFEFSVSNKWDDEYLKRHELG